MGMCRRGFLAGAGTAAILGVSVAHGQAIAQAAPDAAGALTAHELPPLPYAYNALEPVIDEQTVRLHHDKHHAGYVKGLVVAETKLAEARASGDNALAQHWARKAAFHGAGAFLHALYWESMAPAGQGGAPEGPLAEAITRDFGSFDAFKTQLSEVAIQVEGSGWGILAARKADGRLLLLQAENHEKWSPWDATPILCVDVWEHAYYLKYQNDRKAYVAAWWSLVNWAKVTAAFTAAL